ncbi:helix-turn-helix domain-containing protein [Bradyrhizobium sp. CCGUVB14]|uniref:helix-turn-helix domain-containing protein n=1 Tax=Bradyrhizobium sp. CCGUVB14 TaxID=2949628 RepID=UPI0020B401F9|nr:helix-turn-helix domain-containing protein [Bradyrhizobium sp. CCGUVB14]MCP3447330.1 helix-turn-helix domain-containing protein [Bradyrhizobium sp. CCGUVB14]
MPPKSTLFSPDASFRLKLRNRIRKALKDDVTTLRVKQRLIALDAWLAGSSVEAAAEIGNVCKKSLVRWLAIVEQRGLEPLLDARKRRGDLKPGGISADALHDLAAKERNRATARRLRALALLAEGTTIIDTALRARSSQESVRAWLARFRDGGLAAMQGRPPRGRTIRLGPEQVKQLAAAVRARPDSSLRELCGFVQRQFGVGYGKAGLRRLLRSLGFRREGLLLVDRGAALTTQ